MRGRYARALFACLGVVGILGAVSVLLGSALQHSSPPGLAPNPTPPAIRTAGFHLLPDLPGVVESPPFRQNGGAYQILSQQIIPDSHFAMSASWLDGTGRRTIALKYPCDDGQTAVSADGMWLACLANGATSAATNPTYYLEAASLSASGTPHQATIRLDAATDYRLPVWSPDGAYLALVRSPHTTGACSVQIFVLSSDHSSATLRTTLTSADPSTCAVARLGWSSDGARLLILMYAPAEPDANGNVARGPLLVDTQVPVGALLQSGTSAATIPAANFTSVGRLQGSGGYHPYTWNPVSGALAIITGNSFESGSGNPAQIVVYTPGQRETQTLFTLPYRGFTLLSLDWSSDGSDLLVGVGGVTCGDCGLGVQNWYLYTPGDQLSTPAATPSPAHRATPTPCPRICTPVLGGTQHDFTAAWGPLSTPPYSTPCYDFNANGDGATWQLSVCLDGFEPGTDGQARVSVLEFRLTGNPSLTYVDAERMAGNYVPPDATYQYAVGTLNVYRSALLARAFPASDFEDLTHGVDLVPPGTFSINCVNHSWIGCFIGIGIIGT